MTEENADQIIRCIKECWWRAGILLALTVGAFLLIASGWPEWSKTLFFWVLVIVFIALIIKGVSFVCVENKAAWVQAVGSILAVGVAIYIPFQMQLNENNRKKKEREAEVTLTLNMTKKTVAYVNGLMVAAKRENIIAGNPSEQQEIIARIIQRKTASALDGLQGQLDKKTLGLDLSLTVLKAIDLIIEFEACIEIITSTTSTLEMRKAAEDRFLYLNEKFLEIEQELNQ